MAYATTLAITVLLFLACVGLNEGCAKFGQRCEDVKCCTPHLYCAEGEWEHSNGAHKQYIHFCLRGSGDAGSETEKGDQTGLTNVDKILSAVEGEW